MLSRQDQLLKKIIQIYIKTAEPVGSLRLSDGARVSSATIRHEMTALESAGYIYQPHTSAGRVPTEQGYRFYVENFVESGKIDRSCRQKLAALMKQTKGEDKIKGLARTVAAWSREAVIVAFSPHQLYFTGLSYLFSKPEFAEQARITYLSQVLDHCEKVMPQILELLEANQKILIGQDNPFSPFCSLIGFPFKNEGLFGLLGPMRMDYEKNLGIIEAIEKLIS